jgi:protein-disulfide isomerase/uncharacterized membrane protein
MKMRVQIALAGALISVGICVYLAYEYYAMKYGFASGPSICNLNAKFDCDAVAASGYAAFLNIPIALWGLAANLVFFVVALIAWLEWTEHPERYRRWAFLLATILVTGSIIMGSISTFLLTTWCPFCLCLYALSVVIFAAYFSIPREPVSLQLKADVAEIGGDGRGLILALVAIPLVAFLSHRLAMANILESSGGDGNEMERMVRQSMDSWQAGKVQEFIAKPSMAMGAAANAAAMTLVEFADFRCSHCKHASYTLDAFVKSHPDVRFEFYAFPLDGTCNEKIPEGDGLSCRLAEVVYCAEKDSGKGWQMHHALYAAQDSVNQARSVSDLDVILAKEVGEIGLNWESLKNCVADNSTVDAIKAQAKQGNLVDVRGTPTIFVNGRQLEGGQAMPVLEAVHERTRK